MTHTILANNFKKYRTAKNMTQEQVAEVLHVNTQTVSRWECNTTLPDVTILPKIAALYCVTIDDLYKENSVAYKNYAMRLLSVFEASHRPEGVCNRRSAFVRNSSPVYDAGMQR